MRHSLAGMMVAAFKFSLKTARCLMLAGTQSNVLVMLAALSVLLMLVTTFMVSAKSIHLFDSKFSNYISSWLTMLNVA